MLCVDRIDPITGVFPANGTNACEKTVNLTRQPQQAATFSAGPALVLMDVIDQHFPRELRGSEYSSDISDSVKAGVRAWFPNAPSG
jgi:hypothetical protein